MKKKYLPLLLAVFMMIALIPLGTINVYAGKGNSGTSIKNAEVVLVSSTLTYNTKVQKPVIKTIGGMTLVEGTDYTIDWQDASSAKAGTYKMNITGIGKYSGKTRAEYTIKAKPIVPTIVFSVKEFTYNGAVRKPVVTVKDGTLKLAAENYSVSFAPGCKDVGAYNVTVTMKGNYSGSKTASFKINPKGTSLRKLTKARKAIKVKWNTQPALMSATRINGYQIKVALNKKMTKGKKVVKVKGYTKAAKKIKKLKGKKRYYVRIRTYKVVNGKTFYSKWSKAMKVVTKK